MMKRPRSFISTLFLFLVLLAAPCAVTNTADVAHAAGLPRIMDPRAGDPDEPDDGFGPSDTSIPSPSEEYAARPTGNHRMAPNSTLPNRVSQLWNFLRLCIERR
jgi:hypothetical protein